eukprot:SAG11_NODE_6261_length_1349_cov_2.132000_1_plen_60_part_00
MRPGRARRPWVLPRNVPRYLGTTTVLLNPVRRAAKNIYYRGTLFRIYHGIGTGTKFSTR